MGRTMGRTLGLTLGLLSTTVLAVQVVLLRLFAIESYHHFAYMVIGVALLGFGAAGTVIVLARERIRGREAHLFRVLSVAYPLALALAVSVSPRLGYDATQLVYDSSQWLRLLLVYLLLTLPFLVGGGAVALALALASAAPGQAPGVGRLYAWNLAGSGVGSLIGLATLLELRPDAALSAVLLIAAAVPITGTLGAKRGRLQAIGIATALSVIALAAVGPWPLAVAPTKGLPQAEAFPGAQRVAEVWSPIDWTVAVDAPAFRHAPGLSLAYSGPIPRQTALFVDGESAGGVEALSDPAAGYLEWLPSAAPYAVASPRTVAVLGSGDGLEVRSALRHGAARVTAIELLGTVSRLEARLSASATDPRIERRVADARAFAAGAAARYDLVVLPGSAGFQIASSGVRGVGEDYLNTVEAYGAFLDLVAPGGTLVVTRWLRTPPRDNVKTILTASEALRARGHADPASALAFVRSWSVGALLVRPAGFTPTELEQLRDFADSRMFDVDLPPPGSVRAEGAFHVLDQPVYRQALAAVARGPASAREFAGDYPLAVAPGTDDRPYFGRFLRLGSVPDLVVGEVGAWLPVAEWGYLAVIATVSQSLLAALLLIGLPFLSLARSGRALGETSRLRLAAYFLGTGLGFVFLEIGAIQRLGLFLGHPVYAATAVLAALLVFSGIGSGASDRIDARWTAGICASVAIVALLAAMAASRSGVLGGASLPSRFALGLILVGLPGILLGMPFPLGLRRLATGVGGVGWAWAVDGVASVVGVSLATLVAMEFGGRAVLILAAVAYGVSALAALGGGAGPAPTIGHGAVPPGAEATT